MTITKRNYLLHTALLTVLIGIVGGWTYFSINPHHYFGGYPLIPLFFFVFGIFMINMTESCRHRMPGRMLQIYLLMRVMRMLVSMIVMLVYCVAVREEARAFLLTFIANYLIYLIYDSCSSSLSRRTRNRKRKVTMKRLRNILTVVLLALGMLLPATVRAENTVDVKEIVFGHIGDSYEWHITTWGETHVTIPLPVIVHSSTTGWHVFLSSRLEENGGSYEGFSIAPRRKQVRRQAGGA